MSYESKVTSKGQITIPAALRAHLGIGPGDRLSFAVAPDGTVTVRKSTVSLSDLRGIVRFSGPRQPDDIVRMVEGARAGRARQLLERLGRKAP